jgi:putative ABC transport system permease protein
MLKRKMLRDIRQNKSQFITIFLMVLIGVMVYVGIEAYMDGMKSAADNFYSNNNLQDLNVIGTNFSSDDLQKIKNISNVTNAEAKLVINGVDALDSDKGFLVNFIESNDISKFYVVDGISFDVNKKGVWLDNFYAIENNLKVGDLIKIKYDTFTLEEEILGLINVPDHLYDVKDSSQLVPDRKNYGFVYLSINEIPEDYIKNLVMKNMNIIDESIFLKYVPDFNYKDYIPYNYIMVDVNNKENVNSVKNDIEDTIKSLAIIKIEDTESYSMYQGEIDEGTAYVGVFSGLFLFIALLCVITTMTRVVKRQKIQIGTLKALGFKKRKIIMHYVGYGFWVSLLGAICGILAGRYFIGSVFLNMEMDYFEVPNGRPIINSSSYIMAFLTVLCVSLITYITCIKELKKSAAESLRNELPKVKSSSLNITSKGIFKKLSFSSIWNLRDVLRNKFRTITGLVGVTGCSMLIVCAFGMLNSMNYFIKLQFEDLYNFNYKLSLKENLTKDEIKALEETYGEYSSLTLGIEIKDENNERSQNNAFVYNAGDYIRFQDNDNNFIKLDSNDGIYVTYKLAELNGYKIGDTITWHVYGDNTYYESKIVGFNKDPQNQNITMTKEYLESLGVEYMPDSIYTNEDLSKTKEIKNVEVIQDIESLKTSIRKMLSMMREMISIIIIFAMLLASVIIYNMGILSYSEKEYQFATLKVLGFKDKKIEKIYIKQNNWIAIISIILGLPIGNFLTNWIFKEALDENYDFGAHINLSTYVIATIVTFLVSCIVSKFLSKKIKKIDMVTSLKGNE